MFCRARRLNSASSPVLRMLSPQQLSSRAQYAEFHPGLVEDVDGRARDPLAPRVVAEIASGEVQEFHAFGERLDAQPRRPVGAVLSFFAQRIAVAGEARAHAADRRNRGREDVVFGGDPAQRDAGFDLPDVARTDLRAFSARGAAPDIFAFDVGQAEGRLAHDLAHAELSDPVPRTHGVAQPALVAGLERVAAARLDGVDDLFERGYCLHDRS